AYERGWEGGVASGTHLSSGGELDIEFGANARRTAIGEGGTTAAAAGGAGNVTVRMGVNVIVKVVPSGVTFSGNTIEADYFPERVLSGGVAIATRVLGGRQFVSRGGQATGTVLHGGEQTVFRGGFALGTQILATAAQTM